MLQIVPKRAVNGLAALARRNYFGHRNAWRSLAPVALQRQGDWIEREIDRFFRDPFFSSAFRPYRLENPLETEYYRLTNPIVEEEGKPVFKLAFDVRRFKPEEVSISANSKDRTLTIEAKHEDENSKFSFTKTVTVMDGVAMNDMTCRYDEDGVLSIKAPYEPPKQETKMIEKPEAKDIPIKHE